MKGSESCAVISLALHLGCSSQVQDFHARQLQRAAVLAESRAENQAAARQAMAAVPEALRRRLGPRSAPKISQNYSELDLWQCFRYLGTF